MHIRPFRAGRRGAAAGGRARFEGALGLRRTSACACGRTRWTTRERTFTSQTADGPSSGTPRWSWRPSWPELDELWVEPCVDRERASARSSSASSPLVRPRSARAAPRMGRRPERGRLLRADGRPLSPRQPAERVGADTARDGNRAVTRIAVLCDIHGNLPALEAVVRGARRRSRRAGRRRRLGAVSARDAPAAALAARSGAVRARQRRPRARSGRAFREPNRSARSVGRGTAGGGEPAVPAPACRSIS